MKTLALVLGAGGRLGQPLLRALARRDVPLVAVTRSPAGPTPGAESVQIDLTDAQDRARAWPVLRSLTSRHEHVAIYNLVLDRRTVRGIRASIGESTSYAISLGRQLKEIGLGMHHVLAGTTAAIGPWLFQTPYGLAKQRQLRAHFAAEQPVSGVLLPALHNAPGADGPPLAWRFQDAAAVLVSQLEPISESRLLAPMPAHSIIPPRSISWRAVLEAHVASCLRARDSPAAHRQASHARLGLLPNRWRDELDHHGAPTRLVEAMSRRLRTEVQWVSP
jgi:NAD(P)-dependent dehydrogenase (short-subunit alcohol dehydrogenase family)